MNDDAAIVTRIGELIAESRRVRARAQRGVGLSAEDRCLLAELEAEQECFWDELRRRRSRRYFGDEGGLSDEAEREHRSPDAQEAGDVRSRDVVAR